MRQRSECSRGCGNWLGRDWLLCMAATAVWQVAKHCSAALCCAAQPPKQSSCLPPAMPLLLCSGLQLAGSSTQAWATARCAACSAAPAPTSRWVQVWGRAGQGQPSSPVWPGWLLWGADCSLHPSGWRQACTCCAALVHPCHQRAARLAQLTISCNFWPQFVEEGKLQKQAEIGRLRVSWG